MEVSGSRWFKVAQGSIRVQGLRVRVWGRYIVQSVVSVVMSFMAWGKSPLNPKSICGYLGPFGSYTGTSRMLSSLGTQAGAARVYGVPGPQKYVKSLPLWPL